MMHYLSDKLAQKLKESGFPFVEQRDEVTRFPVRVYDMPNLSDLIDACGDRFDALEITGGEKKWDARGGGEEVWAHNPLEAVALLWLALNKK